MMRNVVLTLIVLIVAIVIFNKNYNGEDSVPEQANAQTTTLDNVLPSGGSETESDTGPLVVLNPAVDSAEPSTGTEPESESVAAFTPEEPVAAVETAATEAEEAVVEPIKEDSLSVPNDATDATSQEAKELIQEAFNEEHGITPQGIRKAIRDITERVKVVAETRTPYQATPMAKDDILRLIKDLESQMKTAARNLEFEKAALLRDRIFDLRKGFDYVEVVK